MTELITFTKDPHAVLDYAWDWTSWLGTDTIATATVTATTGITVVSTSRAGAIVTAWLSGGTDRAAYEVTCRITTAGGRTDDRTNHIIVTER